MTQTDRVLAALHAHREHGITAIDFLRFPTIDGGPPITRVAARIEELRDQGFQIDSGERRDKCTVYRLRTIREPTAGSTNHEPTLFEMPGRQPEFDELVPPQNAIYGDAA